MKILTFIFLNMLLLTCAFSKEVKTIKLKTKFAQFHKMDFKNKKNRIMCSQKSIPLSFEKSFAAPLLTVTFIAEKKIDSFSIKNARGIDGVAVSKFQKLLNQKLDSGEAIESIVELGDFKGLVYVAFDVSLTINGITTEHTIPVDIGTLSAEQIIERKKNIKEIKPSSQTKTGTNAITAPSKLIHEMKVD